MEEGHHVKVRIAVLVVAALAAIGVLAGTASAQTARQTEDGGISCTWTFATGAASFTCTNAAGATLSCNATWSWRPLGYNITCTLPDGTVKTVRWP